METSTKTARAARTDNTVETKVTRSVVTSSTSDDDVLRLDQQGAMLLFSVDDFKHLTDSFIAELSRENRMRYLEARSEVEHKAVRSTIELPQSPIADINTMRLQLPKRDGWHRTWLDGRFADIWKAQGYRPLKRQTPNSKTEETWVIHEVAPSGAKYDLVAVEIPEHVYEAHMRANELNDRAKTESHMKGFQREVEQFNTQYGGKGKEALPIAERDGTTL